VTEDQLRSLQELQEENRLLREKLAHIEDRENLLCTMLSALPDIYFVLDWEGRYIEILTRESLLLYRDATVLTNQKLHDILPLDVADGALDTVRKTVETGRPQMFQYQLEVPAGKLWFEGRTALLSPGDGPHDRSGARVIFLARDITVRKNAETQLLLAEARVSVFLEAFPSDLWIIDDQGRILLLSQHSRELWGDLVGMGIENIPLNEHVREIWIDYSRRSLAGETLQGELEFRIKGEMVPMLCIMTPIKVDGRIVGAMGMNLNLKYYRMWIEQTQKMREFQSLSLLAGGVAHDFNNIVAGVLGNIAMAQLTSTEGEVVQQLRMAEKGLLQSRELTSQLLAMAREVSSMKRKIDPVRAVRDTMEYSLAGTNTLFTVASSAWIPTIFGEAGQIRRVIQNIVLNASQAMNGSGELLILLRYLSSDGQGREMVDGFCSDHLPQKEDGLEESLIGARHGVDESLIDLSAHFPACFGADNSEFVVVSIIDRGPGISPEIQNSIFEPYFTTRSNGTGLGLVTCNTIMNRHGGFIKVASVNGRGSAFHLFFPVGEDRNTLPQSSESPGQDTGENSEKQGVEKTWVLIVDDDQTVARVLARLLRKLGFNVRIVNPLTEDYLQELGQQPGEATESLKFQVAFVDYQLPGCDGHHYFSALKRFMPDLKGVLVTGYASSASVDSADRAALQGGFQALLDKPFTVDELVMVIEGLGFSIDYSVFPGGLRPSDRAM